MPVRDAQAPLPGGRTPVDVRVCASFAQGLVEELRRLRVSAPAVLGLHTSLGLRSAETFGSLSLSELERLLQQVVERTGDASLGLTVAEGARLDLLPNFPVLREGTTLRESIAILRGGDAAVQGLSLELVERGRVATITCVPPAGYPVFARFFSEYIFVTLMRWIAQLHPQLQVDMQRVLFAHAAPKLDKRHAALFRGPVLFNQKTHALRFARSLLDLRHLPQVAGDAGLGRGVAPAVLSVAGARPTSERVRAVLAAYPSLDEVDSDRLAEELGLTRRALRRRLAADGTSLSALVDEARCGVACAALRRGEPIKSIAAQAGYRDHSGLFRAFKRYTGMTPAAYRRQIWLSRTDRASWPALG